MHMFQIYSTTIVYFTVCDTCCRPFPSLYTFFFSHCVWELWHRRRRIDSGPQDEISGGTAGYTYIYMYKHIKTCLRLELKTVFCVLLLLYSIVSALSSWPFDNYSRRSPVPRLSGYQYHLHVVGRDIVRALQCVNDTDGNREKCPSSCLRPLNSTRFVFNIDKHGV